MSFKKLFNKGLIKRVEDKVNLLGQSMKEDALTILSVRLITSVLLFVVVFMSLKHGYILSAVFVVIYNFLFEYVVLDSKIKKREKKINNEAIYFFEVLTLSLQTGRNLAEAISITVNSVDGELSLEFKEALRETRFGKSLNESLNDMQKRIPSDSVNNIVLALTQANIYGSSIISTLNNQIDYLREKRKMEIKAQISKIPTKISVISVFFFIPLILLIILGPVLLNYIG